MDKRITPDDIRQKWGDDGLLLILEHLTDTGSLRFKVGQQMFRLFPDPAEPDHEAAWDCDPFAALDPEAYDRDLDLEMDKTDWQVLALDRFGDRNVNPSISHVYIMNNNWA